MIDIEHLSLRNILSPSRKDLRTLLLLEFLRGLSILGMAGAMANITDIVFLQAGTWKEAAPSLLVLLFSVCARSLPAYCTARICSRLSLAVQENMRQKLHHALLWSQTGEKRSGQLLTLALDSVQSIDDLFRIVLPHLISCIVLIPLFLAVTACTDIYTALLFLVTLPIAPFLLYLIGRVTKERNEAAWQELIKWNAGFHELLQGLATLKLFGRSRAMLSRLEAWSDASGGAVLRVLQLAFVSAFALELITTLSIALIAVSIGLRLLSGSLDFLSAFFALLVAPEFYLPIRQSGTSFHAGIKAKQSHEALRAFLEDNTSAQNPESHARLQVPPSLHFRDVSFCYPRHAAPVLQGLTLDFPAGSTTVISGASGAGKSTLLKLAAGLHAPTQGEILLNELPMHRMKKDSLYRHLAYVPQTPHIFQATLRENLSMFHPIAGEKLLEAVEQAGLKDWFLRLPKGLDTEMGRNGVSMSHGQIHRLGLARAILQEASLLLLDEITAGLDTEGEQVMLQTLEKLCYRRTVLLASHRPVVLEWAPRLIHLETGPSQGGPSA